MDYFRTLEERLKQPYHGCMNRYHYLSYTIPDRKVHLDLTVLVHKVRAKYLEMPAFYVLRSEIWVYYGQK